MKGAERLFFGWCMFLFAVVACVLISPFLPWSGYQILHSATAAAWAQAGGTVAAMFCGAGAIAWQVRSETSRKARSDLRRDLQAAQEIQELVVLASANLKTLRVVPKHSTARDAAAHLLDVQRDMWWRDLQEAFVETPIATIPGAQLKLAFIRAKSGYSTARGAYDVLWQAANGGTLLPSDHILATLERAAFMLNAAFEQTHAVVEIIERLIERT